MEFYATKQGKLTAEARRRGLMQPGGAGNMQTAVDI